MMDTKPEIWLAVCEGHFPGKSDSEILLNFPVAASHWGGSLDTPLAELFDQYVMIKNLKGDVNGT